MCWKHWNAKVVVSLLFAKLVMEYCLPVNVACMSSQVGGTYTKSSLMAMIYWWAWRSAGLRYSEVLWMGARQQNPRPRHPHVLFRDLRYADTPPLADKTKRKWWDKCSIPRSMPREEKQHCIDFISASEQLQQYLINFRRSFYARCSLAVTYDDEITVWHDHLHLKT